MTARELTRRHLLKTSAAAAAVSALSRDIRAKEERPKADNSGIRLGFIGVGPKGFDNMGDFAKLGVQKVALCDVDEEFLAQAVVDASDARQYTDFREMLTSEAGKIDGVVISTPDHTHAACTLEAMRRGLPVYCEKPLTHDIAEARRVAHVARERKLVATQMGNQGHASAGLRTQVDWLRAGVIGDVHEVHVWTDRPNWPQGTGRFAKEDQPTPRPGLHWDLWLGPAAARPYAVSDQPAGEGRVSKGCTYHPGRWRGWLDFGCGALGDMAPHLMDAAVWGLNLTGSCAVEWQGEGRNDETFPTWSIVTWHFPQRLGIRDGREATLKPTRVVWYEGGRMPQKPADVTDHEWAEHRDGGAMFVGDRGTMFGPYTDKPRLSAKAAKGFEPQQRQSWLLPASPGHQQEWLNAIRGGPAPRSDFAYASKLTETILLGTIAQRLGQRLEWDADNMKITNVADANRFITPERRKGWEL